MCSIEFVDGFEEVPLAKLRELLTAVDQEDKFFALVGIDSTSTSSSISHNQNSNDNNDVGATRNDANRKSTKKRRRKKQG